MTPLATPADAHGRILARVPAGVRVLVLRTARVGDRAAVAIEIEDGPRRSAISLADANAARAASALVRAVRTACPDVVIDLDRADIDRSKSLTDRLIGERERLVATIEKVRAAARGRVSRPARLAGTVLRLAELEVLAHADAALALQSAEALEIAIVAVTARARVLARLLDDICDEPRGSRERRL